ncbi:MULTISPECIES: type II toxin-antitoxin system ParD family antitoxin [Dietzia]|uniref:type II toxin-antitoxin system ParD family antitoxin n=1 Tax=Dietzia TaxID=37914 RepID=UPI0028D24FA5|nr:MULTISPECIES: type II toxin-antitoxin system ParD family antitoxin [Dietzia]
MCMPTRNVVLGQQQHELVDRLVASGRYQNASEVLREGLRLLERRDAEDAARLAALRAAADQGWADVAAGRYVDVDDAGLDELIADIGARAVADGRSPG